MNQYRRRLDLLEARMPPAPDRPSLATHDPESRRLVIAMGAAKAERRFDDEAELYHQFARRVEELYRQAGRIP